MCGAKFGSMFLRGEGDTARLRLATGAGGIPGRARPPPAPIPARPRSDVAKPSRSFRTRSTDPRRQSPPSRAARGRADRLASQCSRTDGADWRDYHLPPGSPAVHRQADRAGQELRRPGRDRHREHAAAQRAAPAHRRSYRVAGAADRDLRGAQGHLKLAGRAGAGVQAMLENATRICEASSAICYLCDGDAFRAVAPCTTRRPRSPECGARTPSVRRRTTAWAASPNKQVVHIADIMAERSLYREATRRSSPASSLATHACSPCRCSRTTS